ncbi:MAG: NADH-quinone oxidoreductase subunit NuoE [Deltaproteobacteria bacterium]|nr:NADH-quinone oxidoreductase subunit NuoE [Deltaproteobacteria bacterium]
MEKGNDKMKEIGVVIDGVKVSAHEGMTILEAAEQSGISIPTLCHKKGLTPIGSCRVCVVELEGSGRLVGSCHTPIEEGMVIYTRSPKVLEARKMILELLLVSHTGSCVTDPGVAECELHQIAAEVEAGFPRFPVRGPRFYPVEELNPYVQRDMSKCILCYRCIRVCTEIAQENLYSMAYRGFNSKVIVDFDEHLNKEVCKDCGVCVEYCPTGALRWRGSVRKGQAREVSKHRIQKALPTEDKKREELLGMLKDVQKSIGFVSRESMVEIAQSIGLTLSEVYGVATFYSFISVKPMGKHVIRICKSVPCYLKNAAMIIASVEEEIGIKPGETTEDGMFSFELTNCIGACDQAPAMLVDDEVFGNLTPESIPKILKSYH